MENCIFCKISKKEMKGDIVYEDDSVIAFRDINPAAKVHILIIPKEHIEGITAITAKDSDLAGRIFFAADKIARDEGVHKTGFRVLVNSGPDAGQVVSHLHFHLLGGEKLAGLAKH